MRANILNPLFNQISNIDGVGVKTKKALETLCGDKVLDLLINKPRDYIVRKHIKSVNSALLGENIIIELTILKHYPCARNSRSPYKILATDGNENINIVYFRAHSKFLNEAYKEGEKVYISGKIEQFGDYKQITHPEFVNKKLDNIPVYQPIYQLTAGITQQTLGKTVKKCLLNVPKLEEWLSKDILKKYNFNDFTTSLNNIHNPRNKFDTSENNINRLAYDEMLANQITICLNRKTKQRLKTEPLTGNNKLITKVLKNIPFELTNAQKNALKEIRQDLSKNTPMSRLLQGDVGSGKTIVALFTMLIAVEDSRQACIMAPTEVLAKQHYETISKVLENTGIEVSLLTGSTKQADRNKIHEKLQSGEMSIIIGTHALFQDEVKFNNLSLCVIDEQHRFGVGQRLTLTNKGINPHVLAMTATPIPRTLLMTAFGDMESSRLDEKPIGRKPIDTRIISQEKIDDVSIRLKNAISENQQIYWVCPLVEESEKLDLISVQERYEYLCGLFGKDNVEIIHGKMKSNEKQTAMHNFASGKAKVLVATTVIEVGVDVSQATIMIIEHAERFGLSQLHQLRGRIGRNDLQSTCLLIYKRLNEISKKRLEIMRESDNGFIISESDLKLRGPGDILGTRQSGLPEMYFADLLKHKEFLEVSKKDAQSLINQDEALKTERGKNIRNLLYIFKMDKAILNLKQ
ncbi:MAG: ATP-dependent DNA helicase RecG [Alphaproteobacteria bacterium]|nr:ATP-dependent DNA helicase RecG [Alphaproteobacteria bacterium]